MPAQLPTFRERLMGYTYSIRFVLYVFCLLVFMLGVGYWMSNQYRYANNQGAEVNEQAVNQAFATNDQIINAEVKLQQFEDRAEKWFGEEHQWGADNSVPQRSVRDWLRRADTKDEENAKLLRYNRLVILRNSLHARLQNIAEEVDDSVRDQSDETTPDRVLQGQRRSAVQMRGINNDLDKAFALLDELGSDYQKTR